MQRIILIITLIAFLALTAIALLHHGYWGIFEPHFRSFGAAQVFADLVIALCLFLVWMWRDARAHARNPWPWVLLTLATGSIGPLIYLLIYKSGKPVRAVLRYILKPANGLIRLHRLWPWLQITYPAASTGVLKIEVENCFAASRGEFDPKRLRIESMNGA